MGSDESHFYVSLIVRDKVTRQCSQTTTLCCFTSTESITSSVGTGSPGRPHRLSHSSWALHLYTFNVVVIVVDRFYTASRADSLHSHVFLQERIAFYSAILIIHRKWCTYSAGMAGATWNCCRLVASSVYTVQPCTMPLHAKPHT